MTDFSNQDKRALNIPDERSGENPVTPQFGFNLHVPSMDVRWVNASALGDYELFLTAAGFLMTVAAGFIIAFVQSTLESTKEPSPQPEYSLLYIGLVFVALLLLAVIGALRKRKEMTKSSQIVRMTATQAGEVSGS